MFGKINFTSSLGLKQGNGSSHIVKSVIRRCPTNCLSGPTLVRGALGVWGEWMVRKAELPCLAGREGRWRGGGGSPPRGRRGGELWWAVQTMVTLSSRRAGGIVTGADQTLLTSLYPSFFVFSSCKMSSFVTTSSDYGRFVAGTSLVTGAILRR